MSRTATGASRRDRPAGVLSSFELSRATRLDSFRESLNSVFYPAHLEPTGVDRPLVRSRLSATSLQHMTLGYVRFGSEVRLDPGALGSYHVNVALSGTVESHCGRQSVVARPGHAAVFTPREHTHLPRWAADAGQLCIKIERRTLEDELEALLGRPVTSEVGFSIDLDLTTPAGRSWFSLVRLLLAELETPGGLVNRSATHRERLERLVIEGLLQVQPHGFSEELQDDRPAARTRTVKRVVDALEAAPQDSWSLADMARVAGVSGRRLQQGFREQLGSSPTAYLRVLRLERVRNDLVAGTGSVTEVAHRWGFVHLGRFADAYRERFGETPSTTLRCA
jgi:AraC-like DNA-binding protein